MSNTDIKSEVERIRRITDLAKLEDEFKRLGKRLADGGDSARVAFRDAQGYELLTRHQSVCRVLDKSPDGARGLDLSLLRGVFRLCYGAGEEAEEEKNVQPGKVTQTGSRDNRVRSLQIRGVAEFALHVATDRTFADEFEDEGDPDKSIRIAALCLLERLTKDGSVCKLLCNRMNFANDSGRYKNEFSDNATVTNCSLALLCRPAEEAAPVRDACARVLANLAACPRLQRRLCDIQRPPPPASKEQSAGSGTQADAEAIAKMQKAMANSMAEKANPVPAMDALVAEAARHLIDSVSPTFADALVRLSGLSAFRAAAKRSTELLTQLANLIVREQANPELAAKAARIFAVSLVEPADKAYDNELERLQLTPEASDQPIIQCARMLSSANEEQLLQALFDDSDDYSCEKLFTLIYKSAYADDLKPDGSIDFKKLLECLRKPDWADAPLLLFAGALLTLARAAIAEPGEHAAGQFMKEGGFDLLTKHRALPTAMQVLSLSDSNHRVDRERTVLLASAYRLGCALNEAEGDPGRAHSVRFLQMPIVLDRSLHYLQPDTYSSIRTAALEILTAISQRPEVCKLMCNKLNLLPHLHLLPGLGQPGYKLLTQLLECPRLNNRLKQAKPEEVARLFEFRFDQSLPAELAHDWRELFNTLRDKLGSDYPSNDKLEAFLHHLERTGDSMEVDSANN